MRERLARCCGSVLQYAASRYQPAAAPSLRGS
jgi:hypothetical protein